jgi:hypothetical protein
MSDATFESLLIHTCTIKRRSTNSATIDKWGASAETISTLASGVVCLIQQREETVEFMRRGEKVISRHLAFFKIDAGLREDDVVVFGGDEYQVLSVSDAAGQGHHLEASLYSLGN